MLIYPTYIHMCVFISMCMYVICHKQCVLWKMLWERRLSAYWRISRANILLIGWPVSQRPFFRRRQNQQDGPLTYFLSGDILMGTFRYVPPEPNQCASFANSRAEISCHFPVLEMDSHWFISIFSTANPTTHLPIIVAIYFWLAISVPKWEKGG